MRILEILICLMLIPMVCFAQEINKKYSYQAYPYHDVSFKDVKVEEFNNSTIIGSCFYQEWTEGDAEVVKDIFPDGIIDVIFENCNLHNIYIPPGNTIKGGCTGKVQVQNDWDDWFLDNSLTPVEPVNKELRIKAGISIDPNDIPIKKFTKEERQDFEKTLYNVITIIP